MNLKDTNVFDAFQPLIDNISSQFSKNVRKDVEKHFEMFGNGRISKSNFNSMGEYLYALSQRSRLRRWLRDLDKSHNIHSENYVIDLDGINREAKKLAENSVVGMVGKTIKKVGDLEDVKLEFRGGADFSVIGKKNGKIISCDQQTVWKRDKSDNWYNQFPMRIYVGGKFTPAAKFDDAVSV